MNRSRSRRALLRPLGAAAGVAAAAVAAAACDRANAPDSAGQRSPSGFPPGMTTGMGSESHPTPTRRLDDPGPAERTDRPWVRFVDVTRGSGLETFRLHAGVEPPKNWVVESIGGGICAADFDGDGDVDLYLIDGATLSLRGEIEQPAGAGSRLFRNDGGFKFTDVTEASGAALRGYLLGGAAADYDGDGDADLCVVGYDARHLLRNRGDGTFEDVTEAAGLTPPKWDDASGCAWADLDGDGRLDLFVSNYSDQRHIVELTTTNFTDPRQCKWRGRKSMCGPSGFPGQPNRLYLQQTDGTFTDASDRITSSAAPSFQPIVSDLDGDGDLDVVVPNDGTANALLVNEGGRLTDRALQAGTAVSTTGELQGSMGVAVADFDGDLRMDVAVTNFSDEYNSLLRNRTPPQGPLLFDDVSLRTRFGRPQQPRVCWGVGLVDFDQDGLLDAFVAAGNVFGEEELGPGSRIAVRQTSQVLRNLGAPSGQFEDVSDRSGPHFRDARLWRGAVFPDLDGDGDADVVLTAQHDAPVVLRNEGGERNAWVRFALVPKPGFPTPAGARVTITLADGSRRIADLHCGASFASSDDPRVHFGLGSAEALPEVEVRWPDGTVTQATDVPTRRVVTLRQGD